MTDNHTTQTVIYNRKVPALAPLVVAERAGPHGITGLRVICTLTEAAGQIIRKEDRQQETRT